MKVKREKSLGVPMDEQEMMMLEELARKEGMTKSAFIRYIVKRLALEGYVSMNHGWGAK